MLRQANDLTCFGQDQGYGRGGTPIFTGVFEPLARVTLYLTDENGLGLHLFYRSLDHFRIAD